MKNFFRLLIEMFIIWIAAALFPERIAYDSYRTLALVAVTFVLTWAAIGLLVGLLSIFTKSAVVFFMIVAIIISIFANFAELVIASHIVPGFVINGIGTYIILTILFAICTTEVSVNKN